MRAALHDRAESWIANGAIPGGDDSVACGLDVVAEKSFLNSVVEHFRTAGADVIIPPTNNTLFRTYPGRRKPGSVRQLRDRFAADREDVLWRNVAKTTRQNIRSAQKDGVSVREGSELAGSGLRSDSRNLSPLKEGFMSRDSFKRFALSLGDNGKLLVAEHQGVAQSYSLFAFSTPCAYWIYGGNIHQQHQGAMKLLQWEAIRRVSEPWCPQV